MPKAPLPAAALALLREPNPAVISVVMPSGDPMSVATWYLVEDDGTVLVNMDAGRARLGWIRSCSGSIQRPSHRTQWARSATRGEISCPVPGLQI